MLPVLWALVALAPAPAAWADYLESYKQGLAALEAGDAARAEKLLRQAVEERAEESRRLPASLYFKPYLPNFYLGVALARQGKCTEALAAFAASEGQGVIENRSREQEELARLRDECRGRLAAIETARRSAEAALAEAVAASSSVRELAAAPELAPRWADAPVARRQRQADERLEALRRELAGLAAGGDHRQAWERIRTQAVELQRSFQALGQEGEGLREDVAAARRAAETVVDAAAEEARRALEATAGLRPFPARITQLRRDLERLLEQRKGLTATTPEVELRELARRLAEGAETLEGESAGPPGELVAAAEALFAARYEQVLEILGDRRYGTRRAQAHAALLKAAARFFLYEAGGGSDPELLAALAADVAAARQADPRLTPPERLFPPRFRALWEEPAAAAGQR
jgi:hypothetical protein